MKPTIARIVIYHHPGSADGRFPPDVSPAIVRRVNADDSVDLWVFGATGIHIGNSITQGTGPCQWSWPELKDPTAVALERALAVGAADGSEENDE